MLTVFYEIAWLFIVLPLLETAHLGFFQARHTDAQRKARFLAWYLEFFQVLRRRPARTNPFHIELARKGLLFTALVLPMVGFSLFIDRSFSVLLVLSLLLCFGLVDLLLGFTFDRNFIALSSLEKSSVRQALILIFLVALFVSPSFSVDTSVQELVLAQMRPLTPTLPAFGVLVNPVAFICVCIGMSLYLRHWDHNEFPKPDSIRMPLQSELFGIDLLNYKIARALEHLLFYALIVFVFLGGPYLLDTGVDLILSLAILTAKILLVACFVLSIYYVTPRLRESQTLRLYFLVFLPLLLISYPLSRFVLSYLGQS